MHLSPETAYDLQRYRDEAIVKGPRLLGPMSGDAFLAMLAACEAKAPASAAPAAGLPFERETELEEKLEAAYAASESARVEWSAKLSALEAELAAAKSAAPVGPSVEEIEAPLKAKLAAIEAASAESEKQLLAERHKVASALEETTEQGNKIRSLEEQLAASKAANALALAAPAEELTAAQATIAEQAATIAKLEKKVAALASA
jgi:hypothetical protein